MKTFQKLQFHYYVFTQNTPQLVSFLQSPSYKIRRLTAIKLGQLKDINAIPFLLKKLNDPVLKVAETALYAIEVIAKANNYPIDLQKKKQILKERKAFIYSYCGMADFKFAKESWIPIIKEKLKKPIFRFG
ncbi:MAG: HEAT repeat domain-containing protein [Chitinophagales bacterium]